MIYLRLFNKHSEYKEFTQTSEYGIPNVSYCKNGGREVHYNPYIKPNFNGFGHVDLGLPSGTIWASRNLGANSNTETGLFFQWGDTQGYTVADLNPPTSKYFGQDDYKYYSNGQYTKYNDTDGKTILDVEDDPVRTMMGGDWTMPTKEQCEELVNPDLVHNEFIRDYNGTNIDGRLYTSLYNGNTLFIPTAGYLCNGQLIDYDFAARLWSTGLVTDEIARAYDLYFNGTESHVGKGRREFGRNIRGVITVTGSVGEFDY